MRLIQVTPPAVQPVTLAEARLRLRVDTWGSPPLHVDDDDITAMILAATQYLDGPSGILGRALIDQTWDLKLDGFPYWGGAVFDEHRVQYGYCEAAIDVPLPPLIAVTSITYVDVDEATQTLASSAYQVLGLGGTARAQIVPVYGTTWPVAHPMRESVTVRFRCGYEGSGSPVDAAANVPAPIKTAILLLAGHFYQNREAVVTGAVSAALELGVKALVAPYRLTGMP
jgi:uncharacterized phiE125 gp8 family phage protein